MNVVDANSHSNDDSDEDHCHAGCDHHHEDHNVETYVRATPKVGRNDPCSCGSGKKYKKCCG